jgi:tRNA A-37 threonylcarbamoyl transferase component Bud32
MGDTLREGMLLAGRYRVEAFLGRGAMSEVHRATQLAMNRSVALKVLTAGSLDSHPSQLRFTREAQLLSQLSHPNIVQVFDFGVDESTRLPFLVFELVEGRTLLEILRSEGALSEAKAAAILEQIARALAHAHGNGIIHRDLKPANVMLTNPGDGREGLVKVLDFGLAKVVGNDTGGLELTTPGQLLGTPAFASPEQTLGDKVDERSDLYSLGCLLHALVTGRAPFTSADPGEIARQKRQEDAPALPELLRDGSRPSRELAMLQRRLLAKAPGQRPARALDVADHLARIASAARVGDTLQVDEARTDPGDATAPTELHADPEEMTRATELHADPGEVTRATELHADPGEVTRATELHSDSGQVTRATELRTDPGEVTRATELRTDPGEVTRATEVRTDVANAETRFPPTVLAPTQLLARRSRAPWIFAAMLAAIAAVAGVLAFSPEPMPAADPPSAPAPPRATPIVVPAPLKRVQLTTLPEGADISRDGTLLGTTPLELALEPRELPASITIEKPGHHSKRISIDPATPPSLTVELQKRSKPKRPASEDEPYPVW